MINNDHSRYANYNSEYMSLTFDKCTSSLAFFGIESGGRDCDRHATFNLLLPGKGGVGGGFSKPSKVNTNIQAENDIFDFTNEMGARSVIKIDDKKIFTWTVEGAQKNQLLSLDFSIKAAPPTIWSDSVVKNSNKNLKSRNPLCLNKRKYSLPITIHFPDYGFLKIECTSSDVYCIEELLKSADYEGLGLGAGNYDYHTRMNALHYGSSSLVFKSRSDESVSFKFSVLEEIYPSFPFEAGSEWNGLRRNWMNSFSLNRDYFDMGDNILLHGIAHLSVHMKSDLLQVMGGNNELFKLVRRVFEKQILNSFIHGQVEDGEVNFEYTQHKKDKPMCNFIDSTPSSIIATAGIAHWNPDFAKRLLPYAIKAANFILSLDTDGDGIIEVPFPGDYMEQEKELGYRQRNWWDNFAFGHKDIYFNYLCHRALRELSDLLIKFKRHSLAQKYITHLEKFDKSFYKTFYNPETTLMAGWVSKNGKIHDYMFTFAVSMGINEGLIPIEEGKRMLLRLLDEMKKQGYGDLKYGIPGNVMPVHPSDTFDWPCMTDWGQYENGGLSGMNGFHFLTSMYKVGLDKEADEIFKAILHTYDTSFTHSGLMPGYTQSVDWRTKEGRPCGYNYLADNYYFLLAAYIGKGKMKHPSKVGETK